MLSRPSYSSKLPSQFPADWRVVKCTNGLKLHEFVIYDLKSGRDIGGGISRKSEQEAYLMALNNARSMVLESFRGN